MLPRNTQRGETLLSIIVVVGLLSLGSFIFFFIQGWIKDSKDRRNGLGDYAYDPFFMENVHAPAGYIVSFKPSGSGWIVSK